MTDGDPSCTPSKFALSKRWAKWICFGAWISLISLETGCVGYQYGTDALFPSGIQTIHVPIARNDTYRQNLGVRLTEALVREIELRTNYKVTSDPNADSVLRCRVVDETKQVLTEAATDDPRALPTLVQVH